MNRMVSLIVIAASAFWGVAQDNQAPPKAQPPSLIEYRRLTWDDFKVVHHGRDTIHTSCGITWHGNWLTQKSQDGYIAVLKDIRVYSFFDPNKAYRLPDATQAPWHLRHAQANLDIIELEARSMRVAGIDPSTWIGKGFTPSEAIANLRHQVSQFCYDRAQIALARSRKFDAETSKGLDTDAGRRWISQIEEELQQTQGE